MNEIARAIEEARREVARAAREILFDLCDIYAPTFADGGASGDSVSYGDPVARNVSISYKGLGNGRQYVAGGEAYIASHELKMPWNATTLAITPEHRLRVHARGITPEMIFQKPAAIDDSKSAFLMLNAFVVKQGYQQ